MHEIIPDSHRALVRKYGTFVARITIGGLFLLFGINKLTGFQGSVAYIASTGAPMPELLNLLAIIAEVGGGLGLIFGFYTAEAAAGLAVFTFAAAVMFHSPTTWLGKTDPASGMQKMLFLKDFAIFGGLLYVLGYGPGDGPSVDKKKGATVVAS